MADPKGRLLRIGDWGLDVQIPNPALQEWLNSEECRVALEKIAQEVYRHYRNFLPASRANPKIPGSGMENLKKGAFSRVGRRTYPGQTERYYAWVGNRALSYKATKGKPYPRFIEYGKTNADGTRTKAGAQLRRAMIAVADRRGATAAAVAYLGDNYNPSMHQARPAMSESKAAELRRQASHQGPRREVNDLRSADFKRRQERARRERAVREAIARRNANKPGNNPPAK